MNTLGQCLAICCEMELNVADTEAADSQCTRLFFLPELDVAMLLLFTNMQLLSNNLGHSLNATRRLVLKFRNDPSSRRTVNTFFFLELLGSAPLPHDGLPTSTLVTHITKTHVHTFKQFQSS